MYKSIDLFAGIGGIRLGFEQAFGSDVETVFVSEWDNKAQETYIANHGTSIPITGDITQVDLKDIPDCDIVCAGFPCQPFSQAGLQKGFSDTRGTLFFNVEKIIEEKRPKVYFLENVKRLLTHDKGNTFRVIKEHLKALDYTFDYAVLAAKDFGVPQNRERIYMVGFDKKYFDIPDDFHFEFPTPPMTSVKVGDILEKDVPDRYTISDKLWAGTQRRKAEHIRKGNGFGYTLFNADSPYTNTISARYYKDGSEALIEQKGKNPRMLTPRECARLQGFPDSFKIVVSNNAAYKQFGNSVAVPVIKAIAKNVNKTLGALRRCVMKMQITHDDYKNNLLFYTILKGLVQCKLTNNKLSELKQLILENKSLACPALIAFLNGKVVKETVKTYENYVNMLNLCNPDNYEMWKDLMVLALELLTIKPLLLEESKLYANKKYEHDVSAIEDKLSLQYDIINLEKPYGQRVINALLVYMVTSKDRDNEFFLESTEASVKQISDLIEYNKDKYGICTDNIFMIIMDESTNQSIISLAGGSYEDRVEGALYKITGEVEQHKFDANIPSVEYDYVFNLNGKRYGVSAKRTLRERYKQNFEDVNTLSVDGVFIITLGIDVNADKLNNILQRHGYYVVIAQELYDRYSYFHNKRVISSAQFNKKYLENMLKKYI